MKLELEVDVVGAQEVRSMIEARCRALGWCEAERRGLVDLLHAADKVAAELQKDDRVPE